MAELATVLPLPETRDEWLRRVGRLAAWQLPIITLIGCFDLFDDSLLFSASNQIAHDLGLSDTAIGLLPFVESLSYALFALFIAVLADHYPRKPIILYSFLGWSLLTGISGLAGGLLTFATTRFLLGATQTGYDAPSSSMVTDLYAPGKRGKALGWLDAGDLLGILIGLPLQGILVTAFGWRPVFLMIAALSLLVCLVAVFFLREPVRGAFDSDSSEPSVSLKTALGQGMRALRVNFRAIFGSRVQLLAIAGRVLQWTGFEGVGYFFPILLQRDFGLTTDEASPLLGAIVLAAVIGSVLGGLLDGRLQRRFGPSCHFVLAGCCLAGMGICYVAGLALGTLISLIVGGLVMGLFMGAAAPGLGAVIGDIHPTERRVYGFAAQLGLTYLLSSFAPPIIGALSDSLHSLRSASIFFSLFIACMGILIVFSSRFVSLTKTAEVLSAKSAS